MEVGGREEIERTGEMERMRGRKGRGKENEGENTVEMGGWAVVVVVVRWHGME